MPGGPEHDAGRRNGPELVVDRRIRVTGHPRARLRAEVLHDHLAEVPVLVTQRPQREEGVESLLARLADADQDAAREGDRELPGKTDRLEPHGRHLVRRSPMRPAALGEPIGDGLEHDAHRGRDGTKEFQLGAAHHARIEMRQQPCLVEDAPRAMGEILDRRCEAERARAPRVRPGSAARACHRA